MTTHGEQGAGPGSDQASQTTRGFLQQIQNAGLLRSVMVASDVATAVFCTLLLTIPREDARTFLSALPPTLRELLHLCTAPRREGAEMQGREQVLRTIADRLRIEQDDAEVVARIVLTAAQNWLPSKELSHLRLQLAPELRDLWTPL